MVGNMTDSNPQSVHEATEMAEDARHMQDRFMAEILASTLELAASRDDLAVTHFEMELAQQEAHLLRAQLSVAQDTIHRLKSVGASDEPTPGHRYLDAFEHLRAWGLEDLANDPARLAALVGAEIDLDVEDGDEHRLHLRGGEVIVLKGLEVQLYRTATQWDIAVCCFGDEFLA
jgi:hypothetical protein